MKTTVCSFLLIIAILIAVSCKKTQSNLSSTLVLNQVAGGDTLILPRDTGIIVGKLNFYNEQGNPLKPNEQAVIRLAGTSFTTHPDPQGSYTITHVPAGKYHIYFNCVGFGASNIIDFRVDRNYNHVPMVGLILLPSWQISALNISNTAYNFDVSFSVAGSDPNFKGSRHYFSDQPVIDPYKPSTYKLILTGGTNNGPLSGSSTYPVQLLYDVAFNQGQKIFVQSYPISSYYNTITIPNNSHTTYVDTISGQVLNIGLNLSGVATASFVCP